MLSQLYIKKYQLHAVVIKAYFIKHSSQKYQNEILKTHLMLIYCLFGTVNVFPLNVE